MRGVLRCVWSLPTLLFFNGEAILNHKYTHDIFIPAIDTLYKSMSDRFFHNIEDFNYSALDACIQTAVYTVSLSNTRLVPILTLRVSCIQFVCA